MGILEKEFEYYLNNQSEFIKKYNGKYIAIKDDSVLGVFDSEGDAIEETIKKYELGTFLVQKCEPGNESYTHTYNSRAVFI